MKFSTNPTSEGRISAQFAARLAQLAPDETTRAVILPSIPAPGNQTQQPPPGRKARIEETKRFSQHVFHDIDEQLGYFGGQRLTKQSNALGYILVETTAAGIAAIADLDWVRAVMEDQPIYELKNIDERQL